MRPMSRGAGGHPGCRRCKGCSSGPRAHFLFGAAAGVSKTRTQLVALLEPAVAALGYELADLELHFGGRNGVVRLYIDRTGATGLPRRPDPDRPEDGPGDGIGLADCELVSREVSAVLDAGDPVGRDYDLEVSSPGLDRKLVKPAHFDRFAGQKVQGRLKRAMDGRRRFTGMLVGRSGTTVTIRVGESDLDVPMEDLEVVRLVPEY